MEEKALGPSPLREAATFPTQADHVLVVFFFIRGGPGGCIKGPRQIFLDLKRPWVTETSESKTRDMGGWGQVYLCDFEQLKHFTDYTVFNVHFFPQIFEGKIRMHIIHG